MNRTILAGLGTLLLSTSLAADTLPSCTNSERDAYFDSIDHPDPTTHAHGQAVGQCHATAHAHADPHGHSSTALADRH